jgi:hypothetical protein
MSRFVFVPAAKMVQLSEAARGDFGNLCRLFQSPRRRLLEGI